MKKVLIISWYFKPCSLTPSQRITYWVENFHKHGFYPVVVTRTWSGEIRDYIDTKKAVGKGVVRERHGNYEVIYVPFKPGLADWAFLKFSSGIFAPLFHLAKIVDVLTIGFTFLFSSYRNLLKETIKLAGKTSFQKVIISGEPFYLFKIGYILRKKFNLNWIADYRDDWTTNELQTSRPGRIFRKLLMKVERSYEKKWVTSAELVTSVSKLYTEKISNLLGVPGGTIPNGFDEKLLDLPKSPLKEVFTITYSGTLYPNQNIGIIINAIRCLKNEGTKVRVVFLGSGYEPSQEARIKELLGDLYPDYGVVTDRYPRDRALEFLKQSHVLLSIAYGELGGIPSSKLYEYVGLLKPILLCPSDKDVMESIVLSAGLGFVANDVSECVEQIKELMRRYDNKQIDHSIDENLRRVLPFGRASQLRLLASFLE